MSFRQALSFEIDALVSSLPETVQYGTGEGLEPPYYTYVVVADPEDRVNYCLGDNEAGEALLQFVYTTFNTEGTGSMYAQAEDKAEVMKDIAKTLSGTVSDGTNNYGITSVKCTGTQPFGDSETRYYSALFECTIRWEKI